MMAGTREKGPAGALHPPAREVGRCCDVADASDTPRNVR